MSQQPARCPRTTYELGLTWLAGGGPRPPRRAHFIHGGGGSIRPTRHGISSSTKGTTTQGARSLRRANEGHQPPSCGAVFERVRRAPLPAVASCSRPQLPSGITYYLV